MIIENVYVLFSSAQFEKRGGRQEEKTTKKEQIFIEISQCVDAGTE